MKCLVTGVAGFIGETYNLSTGVKTTVGDLTDK